MHPRTTGSGGRLAVVVGLALVPWTVLVLRGDGASDVDLVFVWGLVNLEPLHAVSVWAYVFELTRGLPEHLLAWPVSALLYAAAAVSAAVGAATGREDRRLTGGLLVFAGVSHLAFAVGVDGRSPAIVTAVPVGTTLCWLVAWWYYGPSLRRVVDGPVVRP